MSPWNEKKDANGPMRGSSYSEVVFWGAKSDRLSCFLFPVSVAFFEDRGDEVVHRHIVVREEDRILVFKVRLKHGLREEQAHHVRVS